jgi:hypothetical protein
VNTDTVDVVVVVCPRCRRGNSSGVIGRVVRYRESGYRLVAVETSRAADEPGFGDDQLLRPAEFVVFAFGEAAAGERESVESVEVRCRHGRRVVLRSRLEREIAAHREGKPPRILTSEPPAH